MLCHISPELSEQKYSTKCLARWATIEATDEVGFLYVSRRFESDPSQPFS